MNPRRLFVASCIALIASAFSFVTRGDILPALGSTFDLNQTYRGEIAGQAFMGMAISMFIGAPICDALGLKKMLGLAFLCHLIGSGLTVGAPYLIPHDADPQTRSTYAYWILYIAMLLVGAANGFVEIGINPLTATLYPKEKTHRLNVLHAWWPGGLLLGGFLASILINKLMGLPDDGIAVTKGGDGAATVDAAKTLLGWQIKAALVFIPTLIYGALFLFEELPVSERVGAGVSSKEMYLQALRPMFIVWAICMLMTAAVELGPQQWQNSVLTKTSGISGTYIIMYTSFMMFLLRHFAGPIAHRLSPVGMLTGSAVLTGIGLYLLSFANSGPTAFAYATIYGLGIVYFWPTMLGVTAERFPKGGAFLLGLMGCVGNLAIALILPFMGQIYDSQTLAALPPESQAVVKKADGGLDQDKLQVLRKTEPVKVDQAEASGAQQAFRRVAVLPIILVVIFGSIAIMDRLRGGYKPEELAAAKDKEFTESELASDF
ncbi:MAG: MFS transporter [Isosphaeraceae bacterium]